jgi:hypothetical protein
LELSFETKELRDICGSDQKAKDELGGDLASALIRLLADLRAAPNVEGLPLGRPKTFSDKCVFDLTPERTVIAVPNHQKIPVTEDEHTDWARVTRIKIIGIEQSK